MKNIMTIREIKRNLFNRSSREIADIYKDYLLLEGNVNDLEEDEEFIDWFMDNQEDYDY